MHDLHRVTGFELLGSFRLRVLFDDGAERVVDLDGVFEGPVYGRLRDREFFAKVRLDPEAHTLVWPNGADFEPETLYNWDRHREAWLEAARRWATTRVG